MSRLFFLFSLFVTLFTFSSAAPIDLDRRDVWVPKVLYPHAGTVWKIGNHHNVTWDLSQKPVNVTNPIGQVFLRRGGLTDGSNPLASGFQLTDGRVEVQVPNVTPANDYQIVLMGDSGNFSPEFSIVAA
ncbi:uncharacterized protein FOMMEDRAFT_23898 [Fomitiporia mediterranea MF3/22]|uniref:uncharacterized protein n=1 Tax=Fomitiporia mediterranea (strain MF3/22) TaxID=694068 RepID=UPI00044074F2|nr:uncharacterized protein FOMMEDRAFT_23898 [Fomitiporia mediterranea MF3/22]EJC97835.1 hypothetical protein FOMMEDRAFT_23898 [Fomitiporia mediterranea MF3/22]